MSQASEPLRRVRILAPAKVNLYLGVGARRADGYHDVETVLQAISLADEVLVEETDELALVCEPEIGLPPEDNLAYLAASALAEAVGREPAVLIGVKKRIPPGAGLGGASTDAAAVLVGLARLWESEVGVDELWRVAESLGADVPFFLTGGTALLAGRGDSLVRRLPTPATSLAIVKPDQPVPTGAAYAAFDRLPAAAPSGPDTMVAACESGDVAAVARALENNMTEASVALVPEVGDALAWCQSVPGVSGAAMAGSGSAVFAICETIEYADAVAHEARERGWWSVSAETVEKGAHLLAAGGE